MNEKTLRILVYILGIICLYVFIAIRSFPMLNSLLHEKMEPESADFPTYGDLYYFGCIKDFQEKYPKKMRSYRFSDKNAEINSAEILTFGDSFFDFSFHVTFPERIADSLDTKVYSFVTYDPTLANPFCVLNNLNYNTTNEQRFVIVESIERNIPSRFSQSYDPECTAPPKSLSGNIDEFIRTYIFKRNSEPLNDVILKHSYFTHTMYSAISTFKFRRLHYITPNTPEFKIGEKPWLFYSKEISSEPGGFNHKLSNEETETYCDNILQLSDLLKTRYNLTMIFIAIPNKYTIYHSVLNNDTYNNFLPNLYEGLKKRSVHFVDLYHPYLNSSEVLYHGTDTHWNERGVDIAIQKTIEVLKGTSSMNLVQQQN